MIKSKHILIHISNNGKYWTSKGYGAQKQGNVIEVCVTDLPQNSNKKVIFICDDCKIEDERQYQLLAKQKKHFCYSCSRKHIGKTMNRKNIDSATKSRIGKKHPRWNPNKSDFILYARKVRWLTEKTYEQYKDIINPNNLTRTLCGVDEGFQLDHKISIKEGFEKNLSPENISSFDNLQLLTWQQNRSKGYSSSNK
jgi:uncharacterized pyridoxamine 5'-phosphate oxidase family protein